MSWLPVLLGIAVAFSVFMYVVMDGFDLGIGVLFPFAPTNEDRAAMMNSIAPFWDGNETWLVLGGTLLIAAFPVAYATLLPALYVPVLVMLFALIFRGIAFEFRFRAHRRRGLWDLAFSGGSILAAFCQGVILGAFIQGTPITNGRFEGHVLDFATPFAALCGLGLIAGYALLGGTWLIFKTTGPTAVYGRAVARHLLFVVLAFVAIVSLWTALALPAIRDRWFAWPAIAYLSPVPLLTALIGYCLWRALERGTDWRPFLLTIALFMLSYLGLAISLWPYAVPYAATLWQAASSPATLAFVGIGTAVILPIVLGYFAFAHWVFRGRQATAAGYRA